MKLNILFLSIITFFVQPIFAQDNLDDSLKIKNNTIQEPLVNRLDLEKQFGGYEPPRAPDPLPNVPYKHLDNSIPNTYTGNNKKAETSLEKLEKSLLQKEGDGKRMGGSISRSLEEVSSNKYENFVPGDYNNEDAYAQGQSNKYLLIGISIILILVTLAFYINLSTNKKTDLVIKKDEINDNKIDSNIVEKEPFDVDKIIYSLEKIQMLKESNVITEMEFEKLKKELID